MINWHIYGKKEYYTSRVVGFYKDPQVQGLSATRAYLESLDIDYQPDALYTNESLDNVSEIKGADIIQK